MTQEEKKKLRQTKEWAELRKIVTKAQDNKDFITGSKLHKGYCVHHLDPYNYDNLEPNCFIAVNKQTHKLVHLLFDYLKIRTLQSNNDRLNETISRMTVFYELNINKK